MSPNSILTIVVIIVCFGFALDRILELLNLRKMKPELPGKLRDFYDEDKYRRSQQYLREKARFGLLTSTLSFVITLVVLLTGGLGMLDSWLREWISDPFWLALAFFGTLALVSDLFGMPFSLYNIFVIEEKYGFNKMTVKTWILDKLKGLLARTASRR